MQGGEENATREIKRENGRGNRERPPDGESA